MSLAAASATPVAFDPYDYAFQDDPYPTYAWLREHEPLHHCAPHDVWVLTRHADVSHAVRTENVYSNAMGVSIDRGAWGPDAHRLMSFLAMDPPRQTRLRSLVSRGFTPRRVAGLEPGISAIVDRHLSRAVELGECDWITDFASKMPMDVISELMGVPQPDRDEVRRLADLVVHRDDGVHHVPAAGVEAALALFAYYQDMVVQRRRQRTDDLTSALVEADADGDRLTDEEIVAFLFLMVVAGNETTTKLLGNAVFHLAAHPEQHSDVFADPETARLVSPWIEETLRHDTSTQMVARHLLSDVDLHGAVAPAGSKLLLVLGAANRDERVFDRSEEFDVHRSRAELAQQVSFGGGRHFCLGANLARLETRVALTELVKRVRQVEVDDKVAVRVHSINVRGFRSLPVRLTPR